MRRALLLFLTSLLLTEVRAQALLKGAVMDAQSDSAIIGATIFNLSQHIYKTSDTKGRYTIIAMAGDSIVFTATGYRADTILVSRDLLEQGFDLGMKKATVTLEKVVVRERTYAEDSLARRREYDWLYVHPPQKVTNTHDAGDGFGLRFSPITYFSKKQRDKRRLKKQLAYNEQQSFIDYYFSATYVRRTTGLAGDSLQTFMIRYRPAYEFVRQADNEDMLRYVNDSLILFRTGKKRK